VLRALCVGLCAWVSWPVGDEAANPDATSVGAFRRVRLHTPERVPLPPASGRVVAAAIGYCFSLIATEDGTLFVFGFNDKGMSERLVSWGGVYRH
jgi:hypothetical protein